MTYHRVLNYFKTLSPRTVKALQGASAVILLIAVAWFVDVGNAVTLLRQTDWRWLIPAVLMVLSVAVHSVVLERLAGQLALFVVSVVGWLMWPLLMQTSVPEFGIRVLAITFGLIVLIGVGILISIKFAPNWIAKAILNFGPAFRSAWWSDRQWLVQGVLSLSIVLTYALVFSFSSYAISAPLPLPAVVSIVPLVLLSMLIPISVGGWGIREAAAAVLWPLAGLSSEAGVATSIVSRTQLCAALKGTDGYSKQEPKKPLPGMRSASDPALISRFLYYQFAR